MKSLLTSQGALGLGQGEDHLCTFASACLWRQLPQWAHGLEWDSALQPQLPLSPDPWGLFLSIGRRTHSFRPEGDSGQQVQPPQQGKIKDTPWQTRVWGWAVATLPPFPACQVSTVVRYQPWLQEELFRGKSCSLNVQNVEKQKYSCLCSMLIMCHLFEFSHFRLLVALDLSQLNLQKFKSSSPIPSSVCRSDLSYGFVNWVSYVLNKIFLPLNCSNPLVLFY